MYTREEFETVRIKSAEEMAADRDLQRGAWDVLIKADRHNWIHQTTWFGEPILQLPQDLFAFQEIIFRTRPKYIIELGTAWGGSLLFYSTLMESLGGGRIIGVDIYIPDDLKQRIGSFGHLSERITWVKGSSVEESTVNEIKSIIGNDRRVMVVIDTFHTHEHVLKELRLYSPLVGLGCYLVCCDTHIENIPEIVENRPRPWGKGNNPMTALREFLNENNRFEADKQLENKLLLSLHPGGYLKCCKE